MDKEAIEKITKDKEHKARQALALVNSKPWKELIEPMIREKYRDLRDIKKCESAKDFEGRLAATEILDSIFSDLLSFITDAMDAAETLKRMEDLRKVEFEPENIQELVD